MSEHPTDIIDAYALGELDARTSAVVAEHLATCDACRVQYNDVRAVLDLLPQALDPVKPHDRVLHNILARVAPAATPGRRSRFPATAAVAAALVLALAGDAILGALLAERHGGTVATYVATPKALRATSSPGATPARESAAPSVAAPELSPKVERAVASTQSASPSPVRAAHIVTPAPAVAAATVRPSRGADSAAVARLARERDEAIEALGRRSTEDAGRIAQLEHRLATQPSRTPREAALLTALQNGGVYAIAGTVNGERWHATVLQPTPTTNALLLTSAPDAPLGQDFRVWVLRDKRTYDAGSISPRTSITLEMPMPLRQGDVVAFSREPESTGKLPTQPFLMELPISN